MTRYRPLPQQYLQPRRASSIMRLWSASAILMFLCVVSAPAFAFGFNSLGLDVAGTLAARRRSPVHRLGGRRVSRARRRGGSHASSPNITRMILRPDWERDGRVFGLGKPPRREGERAFEYLVNYPCEFEIKVIGVNEGSFADDIAATVSVACKVEAADVRFTVRDTSSGRYQSVTVHAPVTSADMLYRCYELIDEDPRVKFKF